MWTETDIHIWTSFAHAYGVEYNGDDKTYRFPKNLLGFFEKGICYSNAGPWPKPSQASHSKSAFLLLKKAGAIQHKRSPEGLLRRRLKRAAKFGAALVRSDNLFVRRYELPLKQLRVDWFRNHHDTPYKEYISSQKRIVTLWPQRARLPVPGIVMQALKACYARPVRIDETKPWFPKDPERDLRFVLKRTFEVHPRYFRAGTAFRLDPYGRIPHSTIPHVHVDDLGVILGDNPDLVRRVRPTVKAATSVYDVVWNPSTGRYERSGGPSGA